MRLEGALPHSGLATARWLKGFRGEFAMQATMVYRDPALGASEFRPRTDLWKRHSDAFTRLVCGEGEGYGAFPEGRRIPGTNLDPDRWYWRGPRNPRRAVHQLWEMAIPEEMGPLPLIVDAVERAGEIDAGSLSFSFWLGVQGGAPNVVLFCYEGSGGGNYAYPLTHEGGPTLESVVAALITPTK